MNVKFEGNYFVQTKVLHPNNNNVVNVYIVYRLDPVTRFRNTDYTVQNDLFGAIKITKNATDSSKNKYEGHGLCFDGGGTFSFGNRIDATNAIIFGADMSGSTVHPNNKTNNIYILEEGIVQGINITSIHTEKLHKINFNEQEKRFVLSIHYNGDDSYLFLNSTQELKFKAKNGQILKEKLCVGNLSSNWTTNNSEKTGLYGKVCDFVLDYQEIDGVKQIYDTYRYLMTKHNIN